MAIVKKDASTKPERAAEVKTKLDLKLETELSVPPKNMGAYSMLIYVAKKIGKTSLAAKFPNPYFLCTEPGIRGQRVKASWCPDWDHFSGYVDLLATEND